MDRKMPPPPANTNTAKRRKTARRVVDYERSRIDEQDSKVLDTIQKLHDQADLEWYYSNRVVLTEDENRRVRKLAWSDCPRVIYEGEYNDFVEDDLEEVRFGSIPLPQCILRLDALEKLKIEISKMDLPRWIGQFENLKELEFILDDYTTDERTLPDEIGNLTGLEVLKLSFSDGITCLPKSIGNLANLNKLEIWCSLGFLPDEIGNLTNLKVLDLTNSYVSSLPRTIGNLTNLKELILDSNLDLDEIPDEIGKLTGLESLSISGWAHGEHGLRSLPSSIGRLTKLRELTFQHAVHFPHHLPDEIGNLTNLETLVLGYFPIASLPASVVGNLTNLKKIQLSSCPIASHPATVGNFRNVEELCLHETRMRVLPEEIRGLVNLKRLRLIHAAELHSLPEWIGSFANLECLDLSYSGIQSLPSSIFNLTNLKELDLRGTKQLKTLSESLQNLQSLERLEMWGSSITGIPSGLFDLKNLRFLHLWSDWHLWKNTSGIKNASFLVELLQQCPRLESLGKYGREMELSNPNLRCSLLRNRIRSRIFSPPEGTTEWSAPPLSLWPRILNRASRTINESFEIRYKDSSYKDSSDMGFLGGFDQHDVIFWLLVDHGDTILSRASNSTRFGLQRGFDDNQNDTKKMKLFHQH